MSQQACIEFTNAFYHVCSRGFNKEPIFHEDDDYNYFLYLLKKAYMKYNLLIHSYCLIPNHYHLFLETPNANLSQAMKFINESYAKFFIKKYSNHDGYVFSRRYRRHVIQETKYAVKLFLYINGNAVKHKMIASPEGWHWSSWNALTQQDSSPIFLQNSLFIKHFKSINDFKQQFSNQYNRSWSPETKAVGKTILGDDEFVQEIIEKYVDLDNENIIGRKEMKQHSQRNTTKRIHKYIKGLDINQNLKQHYLIYLLLENTNISRKGLGTQFNLSANALGKRASRVRQSIQKDSSLKQLLDFTNVLS